MREKPRITLTRQEIGEAYAQFGPLVLLRCRRILRDGDLAEDAFQDTFLRLCRYGGAYRQADSKVAWLYRVADRCCFDRLSKTKRLSEVPLETKHERSVEGLEVVENWNVIQGYLGQLEERMQHVAIMYYIDGMTQIEIGKALGLSRQTVAKRIHLLEVNAAQSEAELRGLRPGQ